MEQLRSVEVSLVLATHGSDGHAILVEHIAIFLLESVSLAYAQIEGKRNPRIPFEIERLESNNSFSGSQLLHRDMDRFLYNTIPNSHSLHGVVPFKIDDVVLKHVFFQHDEPRSKAHLFAHLLIILSSSESRRAQCINGH